MVKLIALDLDDTVLTSDRTVLSSTILAVQKAAAEGIHVVVSTGRNYSNAKEIIDKLGVCEVVSVCNGALVLDLNTKRIIYRNSIRKQDMQAILPFLETPELFFQLYIGSENYRDRRLDKLYHQYFPKRSDSDRIAHIVPDIREFLWNSPPGTDTAVDKIFAYCPDTQRLAQVRAQISQRKTVHLTSSNIKNFEVTNQGITKAVGLQQLCSYLGVDKKDTLAIGDSENDLDMLRFAGISVAMGNATQTVKACADYITDSNDQDGIAHALQHFLK
ncbi:MAG TPA: Cof-type HAD-IIB family hydrolase [Firmicutes bacterium]|nr:Cof-type HAD-IIB family hydrolase [Bacillota bacterium]